jgi:hypothetical protein
MPGKRKRYGEEEKNYDVRIGDVRFEREIVFKKEELEQKHFVA